MLRNTTLLLLCITPAAIAHAQPDASQLVGGLPLRGIGPALTSGRISDIAVDPTKPNTWYAAAGSGGVFKTENAGATWRPIFDNYGSYSIGCVTIDPSDRNTVWVGTGEDVGGRHVGYGDGVYVSHDGGASFANMGLKESEHIAKIVVHPRDSNTVYVAAQGPLWSKGGQRGLFKTTDGGKTWRNVLSKGPYTGVTEVAIDPHDPDVLYAATHQRHRTVWALVNTGPESGVFKSSDGGETWEELKKGLPGGDKGKIALAVSPHRPHVVYASIELGALPTPSGGLWCSTDGGASWSKRSDFIASGTGPHYYQEMWVDPHREGVLYQVDVMLARSEDGGRTWETAESSAKHVDNHAVAFHPTDPDFLLVGTDGGLYWSHDRGETYQHAVNLPLTQFYKVDVDYDYPFYHVIGGTQDNGTLYGPTATADRAGIKNSDWRMVLGGDGHDGAIDPEDPNTLYGESQQGYISRIDRRTGETVDIRPRPEPGEPQLRFNWDAPILISPHAHTRVYMGSHKLHRSDDRGDSWTTISPDLSRGLDRFRLEVMDRVWRMDAGYDLYAMSQYGNITSISESPQVEGLIYVGTDDGLVHVTEDGGETWKEITPGYGMPQEAFVNDIKADRLDPDTVYLVVDAHKAGDFSPYVFKSADRGRTWESISGDLPERHVVWRFEQDHEVAELCFVGTEFGVFVTLDGGEKWTKLSGAPTISFRDLAIQRRESDLVAASFGRGFFVLDDYTPLREAARGYSDQGEAHIFPIRDAKMYGQRRSTGWTGDSTYAAPNPPYGAVITYHLKKSLKTRKEERAEQEKKIKAEGGDVERPTWEELEEEETEPQPEVFFTIKTSDGEIVTRVDGSTSAGVHRAVWNLRYTSPAGGRRSRGPLAAPGEYSVQASQRVRGETTELGEPVSFNVVRADEPSLPLADPATRLAYAMDVAQLRQTLSAVRDLLRDAEEELEGMRRALEGARTPTAELSGEVRRVQLKLRELQVELNGDPIKQRFYELAPRSLSDRVGDASRGGGRYGPTETHRTEFERAKQDLAEFVPRAERLRDEDLQALKQKLDEAGVPWSLGRATPAIP